MIIDVFHEQGSLFLCFSESSLRELQLVLLSYHSLTLRMLCWQANEQRVIQEFVAIIDK
jgi:hypothetical protein